MIDFTQARHRVVAVTAAGLIAGIGAVAPAGAQDGFGGSFDQGGGTAAPADDSGGSFSGTFEGSFDTPGGGGGTLPGPSGGASAETPGGSDFSGQPFDDFGPEVVVNPNPNPTPNPTPNPNPQPAPEPMPNPPPNPVPDPTPQPDPNQVQVDPQIFAFESRDFGVGPVQTLRQGQFHAQTPTSIPGGQVVSTQNLANAMNSGTQIVLIDVLGGQYALPGSFTAPAMAQAGSFNDNIQQQTAQWLGQITGGRRDIPVVVYCSDPMCWLSYNASLRAIAAGYGNVYWYRGGIAAWQMAGLPMMPASY